MLKALESVPEQERLGLVSKASQSVWMGIEPSEDTKGLVEEVGESVRAFGIQPESPNFRADVLRRLGNETTEIALRGKDREAILERVANRGLLPTRSYVPRPELADGYRDAVGEHVRRGHLTRTLNDPDLIRHLTLPVVGGYLLRTLAVRSFPEEGYTVIVWATRDGRSLRSLEPWLAPHDLIDLRGVSDPIEAFRKFLERYGLPIPLGDGDDVLVMNRKVADLPHAWTEQAYRRWIRELEEQEGKGIWMELYVDEAKPDGSGVIVLGYVVQAIYYRRDLQQHGINFRVE